MRGRSSCGAGRRTGRSSGGAARSAGRVGTGSAAAVGGDRRPRPAVGSATARRPGRGRSRAPATRRGRRPRRPQLVGSDVPGLRGSSSRTAGQPPVSSRGGLVGPAPGGSSVRRRLARHPAGLGAHDDPLDQHLAGQLLGELGAQPAHVGAQLGELAELLPQRISARRRPAARRPGPPRRAAGQRGEVTAQLRHPGDLVAQARQRRDVAAQRVELVAHRVLGLAAQLVLQLQLVLAAGGDLAVELELVGPAQLAPPGPRRRPGRCSRRPAANVARTNAQATATTATPQVLRVVGEEDRERGGDGQREPAGQRRRSRVPGAAGARGRRRRPRARGMPPA